LVLDLLHVINSRHLKESSRMFRNSCWSFLHCISILDL